LKKSYTSGVFDYEQLCDWLAIEGVDVDHRDDGNSQETALVSCAKSRNVECVLLLLRKGASTNALATRMRTALMYAAVGGAASICQL
jgi:ankyrin repeat protein